MNPIKKQKNPDENSFTANNAQRYNEQKEEGQLSIDIFENKNELTIIAPIAGIKHKDILVTITEDILTIKGKRQCPINLEENDQIVGECFWGEFSRSIILPSYVNPAEITATFEDNILVVTLKITSKSKTKIIKIKEI